MIHLEVTVTLTFEDFFSRVLLWARLCVAVAFSPKKTFFTVTTLYLLPIDFKMCEYLDQT